jgi:hypothetical protein
MNLIPYSLFVYINYLLAALMIALPWVWNANNETKVFFGLLGLVLLVILVISKGVKIPKIEIIPKRIVILLVFLSALVLPFSHIFLKFTSDTALLWTAYLLSSGQLLSLIFFRLDE